MSIPLQISFRNMDPSPAVEERISEKAEKLERFHDRIVGCTLVVEAPHRHHHKGKLYNVRLDISVPRKDVVVDRAKPIDHAHEDVYVAVSDAFDAAVRRLEDRTQKMRGSVKTHAGRPPAEGCRSCLPEGLDRGEPRERLFGLAQQCLFGVGCGAVCLRYLSGVNGEAVSDQRTVRGEIVETAKSILHILEHGERVLPPLGARLARKRAGKEFDRVAQPLGANAQFVTLLDAQTANVRAIALDALAKL